MTIQDLGALGEFLGSIAVLATLVYLALQTRQNTMAIRAQLDGARLTSVMTLSLAAVTSNEVQEALNEDRRRSPHQPGTTRPVLVRSILELPVAASPGPARAPAEHQ